MQCRELTLLSTLAPDSLLTCSIPPPLSPPRNNSTSTTHTQTSLHHRPDLHYLYHHTIPLRNEHCTDLVPNNTSTHPCPRIYHLSQRRAHPCPHTTRAGPEPASLRPGWASARALTDGPHAPINTNVDLPPPQPPAPHLGLPHSPPHSSPPVRPSPPQQVTTTPLSCPIMAKGVLHVAVNQQQH